MAWRRLPSSITPHGLGPPCPTPSAIPCPPLVSANFGARNFARARRFLGLALSMVFGIGLMLYGVFALYPGSAVEDLPAR